MDGVLIKKAGMHDIDGVEDIYDESIDWLDSQGIHQWKRGVYPTRQSALDALPEDSLYCCFLNGSLAGTFIINERQPQQYDALNWKYKNGKALVLHTLVIKPGNTGKGLGKTIMEFILDYARRNAYESIRLDAFPGNNASKALYGHFGFEFAGRVFFDIKEPGYEWYDCYEKLISDVNE
jgi:RimJ/RimL family protein N-acetyltransferase